jgi:hypothetical protein
MYCHGPGGTTDSQGVRERSGRSCLAYVYRSHTSRRPVRLGMDSLAIVPRVRSPHIGRPSSTTEVGSMRRRKFGSRFDPAPTVPVERAAPQMSSQPDPDIPPAEILSNSAGDARIGTEGHRESDSDACRTDAQRSAEDLVSPPTSTSASRAACVCPSPSATV